MREAGASTTIVDSATIVALSVLLGPLATIAHELAGHAATCVALGGTLKQVGAYYVDCVSPDDLSRRWVSAAGVIVDGLLFALAFALWRSARGDRARLILWYVFVVHGMAAGGYFMFSGLTGIGDWGLEGSEGVGPVANPLPWRIALFALGLALYVGITRLAIRTMTAMVGGGAAAQAVRKRLALIYYAVSGATAVAIGLLNPQGLFITLASALASTLGGTAGLWNVAYAHPDAPPRGFTLPRDGVLMGAGIAVALAFGLILGPSLPRS